MLRFWAIVLGIGALMCVPASAHPHVFIDARMAYDVNAKNQLRVLRITWVYDEFTSLTLLALLDLDQDNDGVLSDDDLARVVQAQTIWPDDFNGDVHLEFDGASVALGRPQSGAAEMTADGRISVSFDLALETPLALDRIAELRLYDPTYYYAYAMTEVRAAEDCLVNVQKFEPNRATSNLQNQLAKLSREETPEQADVGRLFADVVQLQCA